MAQERTRVCPVTLAGGLDNRIRRWLQNPRKILAPYVREGMTVLDVGCGPGFFTVELARLAGGTGRVIAVDLQEGMLLKLGVKIRGTELEERITLHQCGKNTLGLSARVDFALAFYMVHEIPDQERFFREMRGLIAPDGRFLVVEPPFHTSRKAFEEMVAKARDAGLNVTGRPKIFPNLTAVFVRNDAASGTESSALVRP